MTARMGRASCCACVQQRTTSSTVFIKNASTSQLPWCVSFFFWHMQMSPPLNCSFSSLSLTRSPHMTINTVFILCMLCAPNEKRTMNKHEHFDEKKKQNKKTTSSNTSDVNADQWEAVFQKRKCAVVAEFFLGWVRIKPARTILAFYFFSFFFFFLHERDKPKKFLFLSLCDSAS